MGEILEMPSGKKIETATIKLPDYLDVLEEAHKRDDIPEDIAELIKHAKIVILSLATQLGEWDAS